MPLLLFSLIAVPLCASPWWQHRAMERVFRRERAAIALDNGAILLGQAVREEGRRWEAFRRELARWEAAHHAAHTCARIPGSAASCQVEDQAIERALLARIAWFRSEAQLTWSRLRMLPTDEGKRLGEVVEARGFPELAPGRFRDCWCGLPSVVSWEAPVGVRIAAADGTTEGMRVGLDWDRKGESWQYRMDLEAEGPFSSRLP